MLKELLFLILIISPAFAASNMTEAQILHGMELARWAGAMDAGALAARSLYDGGQLDYSKYWDFVKTANQAIRNYNTFVVENFNQSVVDELKMAEYNL